MAYILASHLHTYEKDKNGITYPVILEDINSILTNIKQYIPKANSIVFVANDPDNLEINDEKATCLFKSFDLTGLKFKTKTILDSRNKDNAKEIIEKADLVFLTGGRMICQMKFFNSINLKKLLKNFKGLVISISAGSMNQCKTVCNFPEAQEHIKEPRWIKGLGLFDFIFIPHFDGETKEYQMQCDGIDVVNDWILPASTKKELIGQPNYSYIFLDKNTIKFYGIHYKIKNQKITPLKN